MYKRIQKLQAEIEALKISREETVKQIRSLPSDEFTPEAKRLTEEYTCLTMDIAMLGEQLQDLEDREF